MKYVRAKSYSATALTVIVLVIVATSLNLVAAEDKSKTKTEPKPVEDEPHPPPPTTTKKPATVKASSARTNNNNGFKPSSYEFEQSMRQNSHQMTFPESEEQPKVKRQEQPTVVRLFDGPEPGQSHGRVDEEEGHEEGENLDQAPPPKAPRGYYDESSHYRDFGSGNNAYGNGLPNASDEDNEVEAPHPHQYPQRPQQNSFRQDPIVNQYRSSPNKYQTQYGPPTQTPGNARRPSQSPAYNGGGSRNPYSYEVPAPSPYYGYTPIVNDYTKPSIIASVPYHHSGLSGPAMVQSEPGSLSEGAHTVRQTHSEIGFEIGPGVGKALKLLLPSALLLTGMSALFPNRVYVPTQPKNLQRQKRGADYVPVNSDENIEYIPASLLRREHRTDDADPELYDYDDGTPSAYYGTYSPAHKAKNLRPSVETVPRSQNGKVPVPEFLPIPTSKASSSGRDLDPFDLPPQDEYDAFQFKSNKEAAKPKPKPAKIPASGGERTPRVLASTIKSSPVAGSPTSMTPITSTATTTTTSSSNTISAPVTSSAKRSSRKRVKPAAGVQVTPTGTAALALPVGTAPTIAPTAKVTTVTSTTPKVKHFPIMDEALQQIMASAATLAPIEEQIQKQLQQQLQQEAEKKSLNTPTPQQELFKKDEKPQQSRQFDFSPQGPIMGLLNAAVEHRQDSDVCQRRALCDLAMRGTNPTATRFETFLWALANLTPNAFTAMYDIDDVFQTIREKNCARYKCANPNLDIQIQ